MSGISAFPKGSCKALQVTKRYQVSGEEWAGEVAASGGRKRAGWFEAQRENSWMVLSQSFNAQGSYSVLGSHNPWHEGSSADSPFC